MGVCVCVCVCMRVCSYMQDQLPGPAFYSAIDTLQNGLKSAQTSIDGWVSHMTAGPCKHFLSCPLACWALLLCQGSLPQVPTCVMYSCVCVQPCAVMHAHVSASCNLCYLLPTMCAPTAWFARLSRSLHRSPCMSAVEKCEFHVSRSLSCMHTCIQAVQYL